MKKIFAISGSTRYNSSNLRLLKRIAVITKDKYEVTIFDSLSELPHFNPDLDHEHSPSGIISFRKQIEEADGVIICTPEYVFSLPGSLKNALEWCVSTVIFSEKPAGLITASASGVKGQEELKLVMKTIGAKFTEETILLIQGIKGKIDDDGNITHHETSEKLDQFLAGFDVLLNS